MAEEQPPVAVGSQIMSMLAEQTASKQDKDWKARFLQFFAAPAFKPAAFAGLTGFFAAVLLMRSGFIQYQSPAANEIQLSHRSSEEMAKPEQLQEPAIIVKKQESDSKAKSMRVFRPPQPQKEQTGIAPTDFSQVPQSDKIPGAISFSLSEEGTIASGKIPMTETEEDSAQIPQLAMARESHKAMSPAAPERMQPRLMGQTSMKMAETFADETAAEIPQEDSRAAELADIIHRHQIPVSPGFLKLEDLAMRGFISSTQLKKLTPPPGNGWYIENATMPIKIVLKKR
jgi:hypothetical protein